MFVLVFLPCQANCIIENVSLLRLNHWLNITHRFYPRMVLAFGYCYLHLSCLCQCVCVSVCQPSGCLGQNSSPVQAKTTKFGQKVQNNLVKLVVVLGSDWPWPSMSNLTWKSKFTPFWACPCDKSPAIQVRISKIGLKYILALLRSLLIWDSLTLIFNLIFNFKTYFNTKLICTVFCQYLVRSSFVYI